MALRPTPVGPTNFCTEDFGPLEVDYDYEAVGEALDRSKIELRPFNMWRYRELLPVDGEPTVGLHTGGTPLVNADRLAAAIGLERLWVKNDAVNCPTLSFKDRVVAVAEQGEGVRPDHGWLRLDRQPGQQRGGPGRLGRVGQLRFHRRR